MSTTMSVTRRAFGLGHVRVPDVEDQDDTRLLAAVPGFVLVRVVEHDDPPFLPLVQFAADTFSAHCSGTISGR